jgi:hypothetical protein
MMKWWGKRTLTTIRSWWTSKSLPICQKEFRAVVAKNNWNGGDKYNLYSVNMRSPDKPVRLCHLVMHAASKFKIFGDDAYGKVTLHCRIGAHVVNYLMEKNHVFFPLGSGCTWLPVCARPLNDKTFKNIMVELLKWKKKKTQ